MIVPDEAADQIVAAIISENQTGQIGDGKVFVSSVVDMLRVRTGERGNDAIA
jgi:nitrogen regulatory protein P-II 1